MRTCFVAALLWFAAHVMPAQAGIPQLAAGVKIMNGTNVLTADSGYAVPAVADWNNDGKIDLMVGQFSGKIRLFLNQSPSNTPVFNGSTLIQANGSDISLTTH